MSIYVVCSIAKYVLLLFVVKLYAWCYLKLYIYTYIYI